MFVFIEVLGPIVGFLSARTFVKLKPTICM